MSDPRTTRPEELLPDGFFAFRTPALSFDELAAWSEGLGASATSRERLVEALAADRARLREKLREIVARPRVREALFLASPGLEERIPIWVATPESEDGRKVERALVRYFSRMAARPTPFGLFAGCSVGQPGPATRLRLAACELGRRHSRLDMDFLFALAEEASRLPGLARRLTFRPSSGLYRIGGQVRCAAARVEKRVRRHELISVETTPYLEATLERARDGATLEALAGALADEEVSHEEAADYVRELVHRGLLVPDLEPAVTGHEPAEELARMLTGFPETATFGERIAGVVTALAGIDAAGHGTAPERYREIARGLADLPAEPNIARLFQVDLVKPADSLTLGPEVIRQLVLGANVLQRLGPARDPLRDFAERFATRYGDQEVPLLVALDEESGIGFETSRSPGASAEPLVADLAFSQTRRRQVQWGARERRLLALIDAARRRGSLEVRLGEEDLDALATRDPLPLPDALSVVATVAARSEEAVAAGDFQVLVHGVFGPPGARLLGRLCHADAELRRHVERHLAAEESRAPGAVLAEVVHLPEGRLGNVLLRPLLRGWEIPFLGRSGAPEERQIPVSDLVLRLVNEQVVLWSRRLGREVIPRLTTAHNFQGPRNLGVYRLLGALQQRGVAGSLAFGWEPLDDAPFLPRVVHGRLVLARAQWRLGREETAPLDRGDRTAIFQAVRRLREELTLPRWVALAEADNELPVDLENVLSVETFAHLARERGEIRLVELFPAPDALCARGPEGRYTHEVVLPLLREGPPAPRPAVTASRPPARREWSAAPGTDWLFAKLYAGAATLDRALVEMVAPVAARALASGAADLWFFIRYVDPDLHLRLRFHGPPERLAGEVLPDLERTVQPWLEADRISRLELGTYEREVERYGGVEGIALAERMFWADSTATVELVSWLPGQPGAARARWQLALAGIDRLLDDLGLDLPRKHEAMALARADFGRRFEVDGGLIRQLGERFRAERAGLERLLGWRAAEDAPLAPGLAAFTRRSGSIVPLARELRTLERTGRLSLPVDAIAGSLVHMFTNRLLRSAALEQELVLYDWLERLYASRLARIRKGT